MNDWTDKVYVKYRIYVDQVEKNRNRKEAVAPKTRHIVATENQPVKGVTIILTILSPLSAARWRPSACV